MTHTKVFRVGSFSYFGRPIQIVYVHVVSFHSHGLYVQSLLQGNHRVVNGRGKMSSSFFGFFCLFRSFVTCLTRDLFCLLCVQVIEFNFLRANCQEPLATFLEYITYEYMIENVMMLLKGTLSGRDVNELIEQCHPMVRHER